MFLQVFFFITNVIGWWRWAHPKPFEEDSKHELRISFMERRQLFVISLLGLVGTFLMGGLASNLHHWFPRLFSMPSAFPYLDSFVTVMSIMATYLMIEKKIECWVIWIIVDIVATGLYFAKDIKFVGIEYLAFCFIAAFGLSRWVMEFRSYKQLV